VTERPTLPLDCYFHQQESSWTTAKSANRS
jgi:hypothetical protein